MRARFVSARTAAGLTEQVRPFYVGARTSLFAKYAAFIARHRSAAQDACTTLSMNCDWQHSREGFKGAIADHQQGDLHITTRAAVEEACLLLRQDANFDATPLH